jgi:protein-disulfide isomerase
MKLRPMLVALAALAVAVPAMIADAQPRRAAAQRDWSRSIVATPEGGYRMGNPNAQVRIVEYLSLTCPHCRQFAATGMPQLMPQIRSGRTSVEYRNFVLNQVDLAAAMLSRCVSPTNYFRFTDAILASQPNWMPRVQDMTDESASTPAAAMQHLGRIVTTGGLDRMAVQYGMTPASVRTCMSDRRGLDRIIAMREAGERAGVTGTPSFSVNGRLAAHAHDWESLAPLIPPARR